MFIVADLVSLIQPFLNQDSHVPGQDALNPIHSDGLFIFRTYQYKKYGFVHFVLKVLLIKISIKEVFSVV